MNKIFSISLVVIASLIFSGCSVLKDLDLDKIGDALSEGGLSNSEIISGLKEALVVGTGNSVNLTNKTDGFLRNALIKIAIPPEAQKVVNAVEKLPGGIGTKLVDEFIVKLNRSAEDASGKAKPIFVNAIKGMSITDGLKILQGADNEATRYLRSKTYNGLISAFKPDIKTSLNKVKLQNAWEDVTKLYNKIPGRDPVNVDLAQYVTERTTDGLFKMIEKEEKKIRENPAARVTDILKKVFGSLDN